MEKVPDAKTLVRLGQAVGPEALRDLHDRLVAIAQERKVIHGRKMRVTPPWWNQTFITPPTADC